MLISAFSPTIRVCASKRIVKPLLRTKDPLRSSPSAEHYLLPTGSTFIVRPPPSTLPASMVIPSTLNRSSIPEREHLLPLSRSSDVSSQTSTNPIEKKILSAVEIEELQALRRSNPGKWTRSKLAEKFGLANPMVVGMFGWGEGPEGRRAEKNRQLQVDHKRQAVEQRWGWKKSIAREERRRRRTMW